MIESDYTLTRNDGKEEMVFKTPKALKKIENLSLIEGPNSKGKSTFLNLLALGFRIHELKKLSAGFVYKTHINDGLRQKVEKLLQSEHQKTTFEFNITSDDKHVKLNLKKASPDSPEIEIREWIGGKGPTPLAWEKFISKYNVIYDIPENPTERLNMFAGTISQEQLRLQSDLQSLAGRVREYTNAIKNTRDPKRLGQLRKDLEQAGKRKAIYEVSIPKINERLQALEEYNNVKNYVKIGKRLEDHKTRLEDAKRKKNKEKKKYTKESKDYMDQLGYATIAINEIQPHCDTLADLLQSILPPKESYRLDLFKDAYATLRSALKEFEFNDGVTNQIAGFKNILIKEEHSIKNDKSTMEMALYKDLIAVLQNYTEKNLNVPGTSLLVEEFIAKLRELERQNGPIAIRRANIDSAMELVTKIDTRIKGLEREVFPELRKLQAELSVAEASQLGEETVTDSEEEIQKIVTNLQHRLRPFEQLYAAMGKPRPEDVFREARKVVPSIEQMTDEQLDAEIRMENERLTKETVEARDAEVTELRLGQELERLEKQEPHKYELYITELDALEAVIGGLQSRIRSYGMYINNMIERKPAVTADKEMVRYYDVVFSYLARVLGTFLHIDATYTPTRVDIVSGVITTSEGRTVYLSDMGTGQTQAAYLRSRLNTQDDRMIIAMFDEVAMMDERSLGTVYKEFTRLHDKGKLLIGIVVQKADKGDLKVTPLAEV